MKTNYLFPAVFKKIGWILLAPFCVLSLYCLFTFPELSFGIPDLHESEPISKRIMEQLFLAGEDGFLDEISTIGFAIALLFVGFSRERDEDECITKLRMESLVWAILVNYLFLILATLFIYGESYLYVSFISMFTVLILFIIKYNWVLYHFRKTEISDE